MSEELPIYEKQVENQENHNKSCFKARIIEKESDEHIHLRIKENVIATFSKTPSKETLDMVNKLVEKAESFFNSEKCIIGIEDCKGCSGICRKTC